MKHRVAGIVLAASVVGGVAVGVAAAAMSSDSPPVRAAARTTSAAPTPTVPDVEVKDPVLVMNDDGTATLSATLINHLKKPLEINNATNGRPEDLEAPPMLVFGYRMHTAIEQDKPIRIGGVGDDYRLRLSDRVQVGSTLPVTIRLRKHNGYDSGSPQVTFVAPVVARTAAHAAVANNGPNNDISVHDAVIVVVAGQAKAFIGGWLESTIDDGTELTPTAVSPRGPLIDVLHQTATGGPSGFFAEAGEKTLLGYPSYLDAEGDRDYVRASDVTVGQTITMTFRFPSGDVVGKFKVVRGNPDGTIAS